MKRYYIPDGYLVCEGDSGVFTLYKVIGDSLESVDDFDSLESVISYLESRGLINSDNVIKFVQL